MANYQPVSYQTFGGKFFTRSQHYLFSAADMFCQVSITEMPRAVHHAPLAFLQGDDGFVPVMLQGLQQGENAFVSGDGRWLTPYIPALYRSYPFRALRADADTLVLCFDMDSGLLAPGGEAFFAEDGQPTVFIQQINHFLQQCELDRQRTLALVKLLQQHGLIVPWQLTLQDGDKKRALDGVFRVDEAALNALPAEQLVALRDAGALPMAYMQLLSMHHMSTLAELVRVRMQQQRAQNSVPQSGAELDLSFMNQSDTLRFGTF